MTNNAKTFTKAELRKLNWRWIWNSQIGWNYGRMQGLGYLTTMLPVIKRLYGDDPDKTALALSTHAQFFNTTPQMGDIIVGMDIAMEEKDGIDAIETVAAVKTALMGPFAGIGDTIFSVISGTVFGSIAASMAITGSYVGIVLWELWFLFVLFILRPFLFNLGYKQGTALVTTMGGKLAAFTQAASILGLTVVGAMSASMVNIFFNAVTVGQNKLQLQAGFFDKIMPKLPQALLIGFCYWLLGRKWMNSNRLIIFIIVLSLVLAFFHILIPNAYVAPTAATFVNSIL